MVTERRGAELATEASPTVDELRAAITARDELISVMGHELRNAVAPLVMLQAVFDAMPPATLDELMRKKLAMLTRNLKALTVTLDRVGEVSQLREGRLVLERTTVDAQDLVRRVTDALATQAATAGCALRLTTQSVVGRWDPARLTQITNHLVSNAIRHAAGNPIEITVGERDDQLEIIIQDGGPGIAANVRERLFDCFDRTGGRRSGGLGIGLWVVRALCHAMGGTVRLDESGRGARFCVALPRG